MAAIGPGPRRWWVGVGIFFAVLVAILVLFDWDWLRQPLDNYVTKKTQRAFTSTHLHVRLGLVPTIELQGVEFANAPWASNPAPMAKLGKVEFTVSLRDLFDGKVLIPRVALTDADLRFEHAVDGRKNWVISDPHDKSPSRLRISSLSVTRGKLQYADKALPLVIDILADTFDPASVASAASATAAPKNNRYTTRYAFQGKYHDAAFTGTALTGDVISFQESGINFPLQGHLAAGTTKLDIEGTIADAANISAIDVQLKMSGSTLANIYPFLLLPLPATPPYSIQGHLTQQGNRYGFDEIRGRLGSTDVEGSGGYVRKEPRPLLQVSLRSSFLDFADLGPLVGVNTKSSTSAAPPTQAALSSRATAQAHEKDKSGGRILPDSTPAGERMLPSGKFEGGRLKAIDADADFTAKRVKAPDQLEVRDVKAVLHLKDSVLRLDPFDVDFAGGRVLARIDLDARQPTLSAKMDVRLQKLRLGQLLPKSPKLANSQGMVDASLSLAGQGNSIADVAAKANGRLGATLSQAEISNLLDAAAGLNGGKVIQLLLGGDKDIPVRCGVTTFDVRNGKGKSSVFVVDTEQTRIDGTGSFDLGQETFEARIAPHPKHPGILSLRTPLRLYGSFRHPDYALEKSGLIARAGGALALALIAPPAALLPLIETGPGTDVDCKRASALALGTGGTVAAIPANATSAPAPAPAPARK